MIDHDDDAGPSPIDLTPIDPLRDPQRFDALAQAIVRDGMAARRSIGFRRHSVVAHVARWSMPILAAAALVIAAAIPTLTWSTRHLSSVGTGSPAPMDRLGFPPSILALTRPGSDPTPADVVAAFDSQWLETTR